MSAFFVGNKGQLRPDKKHNVGKNLKGKPKTNLTSTFFEQINLIFAWLSNCQSGIEVISFYYGKTSNGKKDPFENMKWFWNFYMENLLIFERDPIWTSSRNVYLLAFVKPYDIFLIFHGFFKKSCLYFCGNKKAASLILLIL